MVESLPSKQVIHFPLRTERQPGYMLRSKVAANRNGIVGADIWLEGMRQAGISEQEIERVVTATTALAESGNGQSALVPVKEAARRIGRSENTVRSWIRLGHLAAVEIPPPPDHANGPWVHINMADIEELQQGSSSKSDDAALLTLREAAERFRIPLTRVQNWCRRGYLQSYGDRRVGRASLVNPNQVADLIANPPRPGPKMADIEELQQGSSSKSDDAALLTLREAAERFRIPLTRVQNWCRRGYLQPYGDRRVGRASLVNPNQVADLIANPPRPGPKIDRGGQRLTDSRRL